MNRFLLALVIALMPAFGFAASVVETMYECDPTPTFRGDYFPDESRLTAMRTYSGFISQVEWDSCGVAADLKLVKTDKKAELKAEGLTLMQAQIPAIDSFEMAGLVVQIMTSILQAAWDLTPEMLIVKNVWQSGSSMLSDINALTTKQEVDDYEIVW